MLDQWELTYQTEKNHLYQKLKLETSTNHRRKILDDFFSKLENHENSIKNLHFYKIFKQKFMTTKEEEQIQLKLSQELSLTKDSSHE